MHNTTQPTTICPTPSDKSNSSNSSNPSDSSDLSNTVRHRPTPEPKPTPTPTKSTIPQSDFEQIANKLLKTGNMVRFRAHGRSMLPFIKNGDILTITPINSDNLKRNDIVFYRKLDGKIAAHRIISKSKKNGDRLLHIRGDGYVGGTEKITANNIMGIISKIERNGVEIRINNFFRKHAANGWVNVQNVRWFIYRVKRKIYSR